MKKKIFITGVSSEIMLSLINLIDTSVYEIIGLTREPEKIRTNVNINLIKGDIASINTFQKVLKDCPIIIHAAAVTHSFNEKEYYNINLKATIGLINCVQLHGNEKFIFISSNTAGEDSGAYGKTKFLAEKHIENNLTNWLILRPSEVYGGSKMEGIEKFLSGIIKYSVTLYPSGVPTKLNPVNLNEMASIMHGVIFEEKINQEKITICGPEGYSFPELIDLIKVYKGKQIYSLPISKYLMYFIEKVSRKLPFYIGIIPDQISRLYSQKNTGTTLFRTGNKSLQTYLKQRLSSKN